jgi:hypothetical protein
MSSGIKVRSVNDRKMREMDEKILRDVIGVLPMGSSPVSLECAWKAASLEIL